MIPHVKGRTAKQAHVGVPDGTFEEEYGRAGFSGRYAHLYRARRPVEWTRLEGPLRPRAYRPLSELACTGDYLADRMAFLGNADVTLHVAELRTAPSYWFRNADADELLFVHEGSGTLDSDFGPLSYRAGEYLLIPRGTVHRVEPATPTRLLIVESFSEVGFPDKGLLGQHALFDPAVVRVPTPDPKRAALVPDGREYELRVQRAGQISHIYYPTCPITTVGWKGTLSVQALHTDDIRPISSDRYHLPPSAHCTFVANGFVVCTFLPRPLENGDPRAMKVPFYHSNIDYDEVLFYHSGDFFSRTGITKGMVTFHPQGIHHGPQPGAEERVSNATRTEEVAVMIDTLRPLEPTAGARQRELPDYYRSWNLKEERRP